MRSHFNRHPAAIRSLAALLALVWATFAVADGGAVRAIARDGRLQISVFTSPAVLVAGEADISVLVQDATTLATVEADVEIALVPRGRDCAAIRLAATSDAATNKLFRACHVVLEPGGYDVEVVAMDGDRRGKATFEMSVGPPPTNAAAFWPWYTWPVAPILLLAAHAWRRRPVVGRPNKPGSL
jgi:hypothetical protein